MRRAVSIVLLLLACGCEASRRPQAAPPASKAPPRLIVLLVVDGLSWERLEVWRPWFRGGLARLLDEGAVATECRYPHVNTETGPGHASIATGAPPRVHGIPLNQWYVPAGDAQKMMTVVCSTDPATGKSGPGGLRVPTLGDRMTERDPRARVVTLSNKDRAAMFMAGRDARHAAYWYASKEGIYATGAGVEPDPGSGAAAMARLVARFNVDEAGPGLARLPASWSRLPTPDPPPSPSFATGLDGQQDPEIGTGFPHDLAHAKRPLSQALLWSPLADRLLADLAVAALADDELALGRDDVPDLLAIGFSANDYVSHYYGPESAEGLEVLRALDLEIGRVIDAVTARVGRDRVLVALSSDHGFLPLREARRLPEKSFLDGLNAAVAKRLALPAATRLVFRVEACSLWLDRVALAAPGMPDPARVLDVVEEELATTWKDVVERTVRMDRLPAPRKGDEMSLRAWNGAVPGCSGDLFVITRSGVLLDYFDGKGSNHGSPWEYDVHVPLIFWGGGIAAGTIAVPTSPYDLAPTLASRLGLDLPDATGRPIVLRP